MTAACCPTTYGVAERRFSHWQRTGVSCYVVPYARRYLLLVNTCLVFEYQFSLTRRSVKRLILCRSWTLEGDHVIKNVRSLQDRVTACLSEIVPSCNFMFFSVPVRRIPLSPHPCLLLRRSCQVTPSLACHFEVRSLALISTKGNRLRYMQGH